MDEVERALSVHMDCNSFYLLNTCRHYRYQLQRSRHGVSVVKKKRKNQRSDVKAAVQSITVKNMKEMKEGIHTKEKEHIHQSLRLLVYGS